MRSDNVGGTYEQQDESWSGPCPGTYGKSLTYRPRAHSMLRRNDIVKGDHVRPLNYGAAGLTWQSGSGTWSWYRNDCGPTKLSHLRSLINFGGTEGSMPTLPNTFIGSEVIYSDSLGRQYSDLAALNRLNSSRIELGINLAQGKQTVKFIAQSVREIAELVSFAKTGRLNAAARKFLGSNKAKRLKAKDPARRWLEANFAVAPLMGDVGSAMDRMAAEPLPLMFSVKGSHKRVVSHIPISSESSSEAVTRYATTGLTVEIINPHLQTASSLGIGPRDIAVIAWDVIPFSFVLDWGIKVGSWLKALSATQGLAFHHGYRTVFQKGTFKSFRASTGVPSGQSEYKAEFFSMTRRKLNSFPVPSILLNRDWFSAWVGITSVSLLIQRLSR